MTECFHAVFLVINLNEIEVADIGVPTVTSLSIIGRRARPNDCLEQGLDFKPSSLFKKLDSAEHSPRSSTQWSTGVAVRHHILDIL
jgi:hypothetical protein